MRTDTFVGGCAGGLAGLDDDQAMGTATMADRVHTFPAALFEVGQDLANAVSAPLTLKICSSTAVWPAVTWLPQATLDTETVQIGLVTTVDARGDAPEEPLVLTHWQAGDPEAVFDVLPASFCPITGTVTQVCELVRALHSADLRRLMASVFTMPDVFRGYWTAPASRAHHHDYAGGLAQHSLEVAVLAGVARELEPWERDLLVAYALLHDIGKVWCYDEGELTSEARRFGHEQLGFRRLRRHLQSMREANPWMGEMLTMLLSCRWKKDYRHPAATLGGIVQAMDRFSAARFMTRRQAERDALDAEFGF